MEDLVISCKIPLRTVRDSSTRAKFF